MVTYRGVPIRLSADFSKETLLEGIDKKYSKKKQGATAEIDVPSKPIIKDWRADKVIPRQGKAKGVHHHQIIIIWNVNGNYLVKIRSKRWNLKWQ